MEMQGNRYHGKEVQRYNQKEQVFAPVHVSQESIVMFIELNHVQCRGVTVLGRSCADVKAPYYTLHKPETV